MTLTRQQILAHNRRHSQEVRKRMSEARRSHSPDYVIHWYKECGYNQRKTDHALGQKPGYTSRYLQRLYEGNPSLKAQLMEERKRVRSQTSRE